MSHTSSPANSSRSLTATSPPATPKAATREPPSSQTSSPVTSPSISPAEFLAEKLRNARNALIARGLYLGIEGTADDLTWERVGRTNKLVTAATASARRDAQVAYAADSDGTTMPEVSPAVVSAVVLITEDDYWLTSCGMWNGPSSVAATFADVKPTCTGATPDHEVFASDFKNACDNITAVMEKARTPNFKDVKGIKMNTVGGQTKLKFRHLLFEVRITILSLSNLTELSLLLAQ